MVAKAMVHNPPVLVLDEPTAGVDVELRRALWAYVRQVERGGHHRAFTTHYLEEAEELCDRIAIINEGMLVANDTTQNLLARIDSKQVILTLDRDMEEVPANMRAHGWELLAPRRLKLVYTPSKYRDRATADRGHDERFHHHRSYHRRNRPRGYFPAAGAAAEISHHGQISPFSDNRLLIFVVWCGPVVSWIECCPPKAEVGSSNLLGLLHFLDSHILWATMGLQGKAELEAF